MISKAEGVVSSFQFFPLWLALVFSPGEGTLPLPATNVLAFSSNDVILQVGEELTYNVSYAHVDVGQVRLKIVEKVNHGGRMCYYAKAYIDSYKGVPFVDIHTLYESDIDTAMYSLRFHSKERNNSTSPEIVYEFDYPGHEVTITHETLGKQSARKRDTLRLHTFAQDGLSLFYFARTKLLSNLTMTVPTIVSEKEGNTIMKFRDERSGEKIDAVEYPVDVIHFEGNAGFVGIVGLSGDFEGWFSNDAARVPILAKMKVLIGDIRIELMKWKRTGWAPPRFAEGGEK